MSNETPKFEKYPEKVDLNSDRLNSRLKRICAALVESRPELARDFDMAIMTRIDIMDTEIEWKKFMSACNELSLRPESLIVWGDDYFDEEFDETVRIAKERGSKY